MNYILLILLFITCQHSGFAATFTINKPELFQKTLKNCQAYDTVVVEPGLYRVKQIFIDKPLYLRGIGMPVLDGEMKYEVITIRSANVTVSGFKIMNSGRSSMQDLAGIRILNSRNVTIEKNHLVNTFFGIYSQYGEHCRILNNKLEASAKLEQRSGNGIHCWKSDSMVIRNNSIKGHRDGIYFEFVTNSVITGNRSSGNLRYGLHFMFSNDDIYTSNIFSDNGAGVAVMFSKNVSMLHNSFQNNWGDAAYGLLLKEISDGMIQDNLFANNTSGIYMEGANRVTVEKNIFRDNGWGIKIQSSCLDVNVNTNNFIGNTFDIATNGSLQVNNFNGNYWDRYDGYDLDKNHLGDIPYHPVSMFSMLIEKYPASMLLFRSFITNLLDRTEKIIPSIIPENLVDNTPLMKQVAL